MTAGMRDEQTAHVAVPPITPALFKQALANFAALDAVLVLERAGVCVCSGGGVGGR